MAKYQVQSPDGSIITVEGPDGASQDEIIKQAQALYEPNKSASTKFLEPLQNMSWEDWRKNSIAGPTVSLIQSLLPGGTQAQTTEALQDVNRAGNKLVGGVAQAVTSPVETASAIASKVIENPAGTAGEMVKGAIYDPEMFMTPGNMMRAGRAAENIASGAKAMGQNAMDIGGGAYGAFTGKIAKPGEVPQPWQQQSVRYPVSNKFHTPENLQAWREGKISTQQLNDLAQPISSMGPEAMKALQKTQGTIPVAGQGFRAFGEQLGETYRNPLNILTDVGLDLASGTPLPTVARLGYKGVKGYQGAQAANTLAKQGFSPQTVEEMAAIRSGAAYPGQMPQGPVAGPVAPQSTMNYPLTVQGPGQTLPPSVMPMGGPQRNVNIEGQSFTLPNQINVANSQAARPGPVAPAQTPKQVSMQAAAAKIQPVAPQPTQAMPQPAPRPSTTPLPTKTTTPLVRSSSVIRKELDEIGNQSDQLHQQGLESGIKYGTPAGEAHQTQLNELLKKSKELEKELEQAKKAEKKSSKKKGPEVSQMLTEDTVFNTKSEWEKANMFNTLAGKKRVGGYREGDNIVREESFDYGNMPEDLRKHVPERSIVKRTQKGKRVE